MFGTLISKPKRFLGERIQNKFCYGRCLNYLLFERRVYGQLNNVTVDIKQCDNNINPFSLWHNLLKVKKLCEKHFSSCYWHLWTNQSGFLGHVTT